MLHTLWRVVRAGLAAAAVIAAGGSALGRARYGASDQDAVARIEMELRQRFAASAATLGRIASQLGAERISVDSAPRRLASTRSLFEAVDAALPSNEGGRTGITIYDSARTPVAWAGRTSDVPRERLDGPAALFVAPDALGPRLVRVEPVIDRSRPAATRLVTIVAEQQLGPVRGAPGLADTFIISTAIVPTSLHVRVGDVPPPSSGQAYTFVIPSPAGGPLVDAEVSPADLASARARWLGGTWAAVLSVLGITLLFCAGALVELRRHARTTRRFIALTLGLVGAIVVARVVFFLAASRILGARPSASPLDLVLTALAVTALAWIVLDTAERWRVAGPRPALLLGSAESATWVSLAYVAAGILAIGILWLYERALQNIAAQTRFDLLQFSLHPMAPPRIALAIGLVLLHAGAIWTAVAVTRLPSVWRTAWRPAPRVAVTAWLAGVAFAAAIAHAADPSLRIAPLLVAVAAAGLGAIALANLRRRARHASQAARLWTLFLTLLVPALAMYPSLVAVTTEAKERLVETQYARQAASQREDLQNDLNTALDDIDSRPSLADLIIGSGEETTPTTDRASLVWSGTELAERRLTSAIELYSADGRLVSRFALNLPEYATTRRQPSECTWEVPLDEVLRFGSGQRQVLRTSRGICEQGRRVGAIAVSVVLDYRTLPFIESQSPYLEFLQPERRPVEGAFGRDVEFAVYGWSRVPTYASGTSVWQMPDAVFQRLVQSRDPFWTTLDRGDTSFRVFFMSDRGAIYALGYPTLTAFQHTINLAELMFLAGTVYAALLACSTLLNLIGWRTPASGRTLLREIRASFYKRLLLVFVGVAVVPVVVLAIATSTYLATQLNAGVAETAAKTALVAQRLVEDYATLQQRGPNALASIDDQIMDLVRRAIDEDVNLFTRAQLQATSERPLFALGLLPLRTPGDVYQSIVLDRSPTFVGEEEVGGIPYLLAAAPVRAGSREGIVTVPVTLRQREIERQIDDLRRLVLSAAVLFSLLGAALGYSMAERIADPINRLTRATRRIARGNLDLRVAASTSDELGRLINDFNGMAEELKRQRTELERTQRLEAWADMARQVAHEIKNPLTPIQLSAEHARRVNLDRGRPLSPVLDDCINSILSQVRLLRQIAAEFSSFASSTTPRPEPTRIAELLEEVVSPYRSGLAGRIALDIQAPKDLPEIDVDRTLLGRAVTNVIENALHAMPSGGNLSIVVSRPSDNGGDSIVVEITDTGLGMDREALAKIFEPYFSTKATGTGLGLTIAKRNVELNGGTIAVWSEKGAGTTVTITLAVSGSSSPRPSAPAH
jgi:signal transduction histidine kinase